MEPRGSGPVRHQCYPSEKSGVMKAVGVALIALGALLLVLFIPGWAWLALLAALLIAGGIILFRK